MTTATATTTTITAAELRALVDLEEAVLGVPEEYLPPLALRVLDGEELSTADSYAYACWLAGEAEECYADCDCRHCEDDDGCCGLLLARDAANARVVETREATLAAINLDRNEIQTSATVHVAALLSDGFSVADITLDNALDDWHHDDRLDAAGIDAAIIASLDAEQRSALVERVSELLAREVVAAAQIHCEAADDGDDDGADDCDDGQVVS